MTKLVEKIKKLSNEDINKKNEWGFTLLHRAVDENDIEAVQLLIIKNVDMSITDGDHNTALSIAAKEGFTEIVKLLLDNGIKEDIDKAITLAYFYDREDIVILLLEYEKYISDKVIETILLSSCKSGQIKIVNILMNKLSSIDSWLMSNALNLAINCGHYDISDKLYSWLTIKKF